MTELTDEMRYSLLFEESANANNIVTTEQLTDILLQQGTVMSRASVAFILELLGAVEALNKAQFFQFLYICENSDETDAASILFFAADLDESRTIEQDELRHILEQLNMQCDDLQKLWQISSTNGHISYEMFSTLISYIYAI